MRDRFLDQGLLLCQGAVFCVGGGTEGGKELIGIGLAGGGNGFGHFCEGLALCIQGVKLVDNGDGCRAAGLLEGIQQSAGFDGYFINLLFQLQALKICAAVGVQMLDQLDGLAHHVCLLEVGAEDLKDSVFDMLFSGGCDTAVRAGVIPLDGSVAILRAGYDRHFGFADIAHAKA